MPGELRGTRRVTHVCTYVSIRINLSHYFRLRAAYLPAICSRNLFTALASVTTQRQRGYDRSFLPGREKNKEKERIRAWKMDEERERKSEREKGVPSIISRPGKEIWLTSATQNNERAHPKFPPHLRFSQWPGPPRGTSTSNNRLFGNAKSN